MYSADRAAQVLFVLHACTTFGENRNRCTFLFEPLCLTCIDHEVFHYNLCCFNVLRRVQNV